MINYNLNTKINFNKGNFHQSHDTNSKTFFIFEYHLPVFVSTAKRMAVKQQKKRIKIVLVAVPLLISGFCTYEDSEFWDSRIRALECQCQEKVLRLQCEATVPVPFVLRLPFQNSFSHLCRPCVHLFEEYIKRISLPLGLTLSTC